MRATLTTVTAIGLMAIPTTAYGHGVDIDVLSSRADQVSGGDALVRVEAPKGLMKRLRVERNGTDVTSAFARRDGALVGLVDGLRLGRERADGHPQAPSRRARTARQPPDHRADLLRPAAGTVRLQDQPAAAAARRQSRRAARRQPDRRRLPRPGARRHDGRVQPRLQRPHRRRPPLPHHRERVEGRCPAEADPRTWPRRRRSTAAPSTSSIRRERGTINRFLYSYAMLAAAWNGRLVYAFDGGVAIGRQQGTIGGSSMDPQLLGLGYAIAHSSGTRTSVHYNLQLGGETALMTKERFVERYGVPRYTVGVGGSGGAIQQYVYGQNHPGLLDAAIPVVSYPDMTTQTVHVGDCELLEHYMDVTDAANPKWRNWDDREWLIGLNGNPAFPNPYTATARQRRVRQRLARPDAAGAEPAVRHRRRGHGTDEPGRDGAPSNGRTGRTPATSTACDRTAGRARRGTTSASSTASRRSSTATSRPPSSSTSTRRSGAGRSRRTWSRRASRSCPPAASTPGARATCD